MYLLDGAPHEKSKQRNSVLTWGNDEVELLRDSHSILEELATDEAWANTHVAYVSRTTHPKWAKTCLKMLNITPSINMDALGPFQVLLPTCVYAMALSCHVHTSSCSKSWVATTALNMTSQAGITIQEIYPGNKKKHFKKIHEQTSIAYRDMVRPSLPRNARYTYLRHLWLVYLSGFAAMHANLTRTRGSWPPGYQMNELVSDFFDILRP